MEKNAANSKEGGASDRQHLADVELREHFDCGGSKRGSTGVKGRRGFNMTLSPCRSAFRKCLGRRMG